jgi:hypothetical protein
MGTGRVRYGFYLTRRQPYSGVVKGSCIIRNFPGNEFVFKNVVVFREAKLARPSDNRARVFAILMNGKEQSHAI